jgi:hypothetical protein
MRWPAAFVPVSIVPASKNAAGKSSEYVAVYERKSTGSDHLDMSNREQMPRFSPNINMALLAISGIQFLIGGRGLGERWLLGTV